MTAAEGEAQRGFVRVRAEDARGFVAGLVASCGVPDRDAATVAHCLVRADMRGVDTHGLARLSGYLDRLRQGLVNSAPRLEPRRVAAAAAELDGDNGLGFVVATRAIDEAMAIAADAGLGLVAARRSNHFGMAANYALRAVEAGFIAFVFTNASRAMPPWGGREPLLGTSPLAVGAPGGEGGAFVLDMSPTVAARGKIRRAARAGDPIPLGWALDGEGRPTTDPHRALEGVLLPIGGPKGSGLSMLMDIMGGVFTGAAFGGDVADQYKVFDRPQDVGHFFLAIRPGLFMSAEAFRARMDVLTGRVRAAARAEGFDEILIAGEPEGRNETRAMRDGIVYPAREVAQLDALARDAGLAPLRAERVAADSGT